MRDCPGCLHVNSSAQPASPTSPTEEEGVEPAVGIGAVVPSIGHSLQSQENASPYYLKLIIGAVGWVGVAALTFVIVIAR
jgi:hypothetical protein